MVQLTGAVKPQLIGWMSAVSLMIMRRCSCELHSPLHRSTLPADKHEYLTCFSLKNVTSVSVVCFHPPGPRTVLALRCFVSFPCAYVGSF